MKPRTTTLLRRTGFSTIFFAAAIFVANRSEAVPVTYYYDSNTYFKAPNGIDHRHNRGVFTLNVGDDLGTYTAESFWGVFSMTNNPDKPWTNVAFQAEVGEYPTLDISYSQGGTLHQTIAIGGARILPGSSAIAEWEHFLATLAANPYLSGLITTSVVPENGPPITFIAAVLTGLCAVQYRSSDRGEGRLSSQLAGSTPVSRAGQFS